MVYLLEKTVLLKIQRKSIIQLSYYNSNQGLFTLKTNQVFKKIYVQKIKHFYIDEFVYANNCV